MSGRLLICLISSSVRSPIAIGTRRTWKALVPMTAPVMFSLTYAFIPWITATTVTRNPTDTMIPSSVKNDRSRACQMD